MGEKTCFECNKCGFCCNDYSTQINLTLLDIKWLSDLLHMTVSELFEKEIIAFIPFVRTDDFSKFDVEFGLKRPCPMYDKDKGCTVYEGRPMNCRIFPYWFITHKLIDDLDCIKDVNPDPMTAFKYRAYERMVGNTLLEEGKDTDLFMKSIGATQKIDISSNPEAKRLIKHYMRIATDDGKKAAKIAVKIMRLADAKVDIERLKKKIPLVEEEIKKKNFDKKIEMLINTELLLDGEITNVKFSDTPFPPYDKD